MINDHNYNLLEQLTVESKSLWRMKNQYKNDSADCPECQEFYDRMIKDKENHVAELTNLVKKHL